ncbi:MAG: CHRD domain-containing protein [Gammaproteobacteria bacterium]
MVRRGGALGGTLAACVLLGLTACNGGGNDNDPPVMMPPPPPAPNTTAVTVDLNAAEVVGGSSEAGTASADFTINLDDETITGAVTLTNVTATGVSLRVGFAGEVGTELVALTEMSATRWELPASAAFTAANLADLDAGRIFVQVTTAAAPDGALRAQIIRGNVQLLFVEMSGMQEVPPVATANSAMAAVTYNPDSGDFDVHVNATGLDDAFASHVHTALAGLNGGVTFGLMQDPDDVGHWSTSVDFAAADVTAYEAGRFYVNLHTPAHGSGEVRGQIVPPGVEVVYTEMTAGNVVPPSASADTGMAASTLADPSLAVNVYLTGPMDTDSVTLRQAPAGQNGPEVAALAQDPTTAEIWSYENANVSDAVYTALRNQGIYVQSSSPGFPTGAVRGQIEPATSSAPPGGAFRVMELVPGDGDTVSAMPADVTVTFNRDVLADTVSVERFELVRSNGDGTFGDGDDVAVNIVSTNVSGADVTLDLTGAPAVDDVYQLTVDGSATGVTDPAGVLLDGDVDGSPGGDFIASFTLDSAPTFTQVQAVFTQNCALSGCHGGATPQEGMNLSQGQAYANIVNVQSNQMPSLDRIEPNDPDNSYLIHKIEGTGLLQRMPAGGSPLPAATIQLIRDWTAAGAPNN